MTGDLPDYEKKIIIVTIAGDYPTQVQIDHRQILGVALLSPTIAKCLPMSIENPAIAYDAVNDRFKIDIKKITATDALDVSDRAARLLGKIYGDVGVITQRAGTLDLFTALRYAGTEIDPRAIRALTSADIVTIVQATAANLCATVTQVAKDRTISDITKVVNAKQINHVFAGAGNFAIWTPIGSKAVRFMLLSVESSADVDIGWRWGDAGNIMYLRQTKGVWAANMMGCNEQGVVDAVLNLYASGATTVKGFIKGEEV
jgi:hypothetical protein